MSDPQYVTGLGDAKRALLALAADMRKRVVKGALRDAARPIVKQARANAPVRTGLLRRRIAVSNSRLRKAARGELGVYIRPRISAKARRAKDKTQDPFYYKFQEAGFHAVGRRKLKHRGGRGGFTARARQDEIARRSARFIPGKAFLGRAFAEQQNAALTVFTAAIKRRIDKANRRK